jgi:MFS family permease
MIPCALLLRPPLPGADTDLQPGAGAAAAADATAAEGGGMSVGQALRSPPFIVLGLTFFACCAAHSGPIFHTVSYAISCGLPPMAAVTIYSAEGLAGLGGRLIFGVAADRLGVKRVLVAGLLIQAFAAGAYLFTAKLGEFYAAAAVFGMAYGGVMPLYAVLARDYFGQRILGTVFGAATMLSSLGMALGPAAGGWIFDTFHGYGYLYMGAFGIGIGAAAIALAFPPLPRRLDGLQPA